MCFGVLGPYTVRFWKHTPEATLRDLGWSFNLKADEAEKMEAGGALPEELLEKCKETRVATNKTNKKEEQPRNMTIVMNVYSCLFPHVLLQKQPLHNDNASLPYLHLPLKSCLQSELPLGYSDL